MEKFIPLKFGEYLLEKGIITSEQVQEALSVQIASNILFGELAVGMEKVTKEQIADVLHAQNQHGIPKMKFGQIAVAHGHLSDGDVNEILDEQRKARKKIGEILVEQKALSKAGCEKHLEEFHSETKNR